jgi:hypothetical protein
MTKIGDKVWVWHFGCLRNVEVSSVTELQHKEAITYAGFITTDFFATRNEAVEHQLKDISSAIKAIPSRLEIEESIRYLKSMVIFIDEPEKL